MPIWRKPVFALVGISSLAVLGPPDGVVMARSADRQDRQVQRWQGVNFSGAEFNGSRIPGRPDHDYVYVTRKVAAPFAAAGLNTARLPLRWERIQPAPLGELDPGELGRLDRAVAELGDFELVIVDLHNYGRYRGHLLVPENGGAERLADVWTRLARHFRNEPRIAFGLMNEPFGISARDWAAMAQAALLAIRSTGARQLVLVPGTRWSGAHSWTRGGTDSNGAALASFSDPARNFAFEMHQYLDRDSSGTHADCVSPQTSADRLSEAAAWLRARKARGFLAEFGAPATPDCLAALDALLARVDADGSIWLGWTYWAAGQWLGAYPLNVQPGPAGPKPQMAVLSKHLHEVAR